MKAYDLKPTHENLMKTFTEDTVGRNIDVLRFAKILNAIEGSYSIALDGNWGSGKTFFVKQTKMVLDANNENIQVLTKGEKEEITNACLRCAKKARLPELQPQVCVYYDAWENDNDEDPILSLIYTILNNVDTDFSFKNHSCIEAAASLMEFFVGRNWKQVINSLKASSPLDGLKQAKDIEQLVHEFLNSLLPEKGNRLVIFIDELDRCKPSYAVRLLERIKHYFSNDRITFVFSVNTSELQHTIRKHYGNDFNGFRYLDRFFDLRVTLPPVNLQDFYQSLNFSDSRYTFDVVCSAVIKANHLELREIAKYINITKLAAYVPTHTQHSTPDFPEENAEEFCLLYIVPIVVGLKISDSKKYTDFMEGRDYSPLIEVSSSLSNAFFGNLLNWGETYSNATAIQTLVTIEDKLKEVYKAIFVTKYRPEKYYSDVGRMRFDEKTKEFLLRTCGLLSKYMNVDID